MLEGDEVLTKQQKKMSCCLTPRSDAEWLCRMVENLLSITRMNGADMGSIMKNDEIRRKKSPKAVESFQKAP